MVKTVTPITFDKTPGGNVDRDFRPRHPSELDPAEPDTDEPDTGKLPEDPEQHVTPPADGNAPAVGLP